MFYDLERLKEDADAFLVAEAIGMRIRRSGSTCYAECVSGQHTETQINHNQLFKNGCCCYSCGTRYNVFEMVMNYYKNVEGRVISFPDACGIVAETCGKREDYLLSDEGMKQSFQPRLFTKEELDALGLYDKGRARYVIAYADEKGEIPDYYKDRMSTCLDGYATYGFIPANLSILYNEDKEAFLCLIQDKCREKEEEYRTLFCSLTDESDVGALVRRECQKSLRVIKEVEARYSQTKRKLSKAVFSF